MKNTVTILILALLYSTASYSTVVICETPNERNCMEITRVKTHNGSWKDACCEDFTLAGSQVCTDDCLVTLQGHSGNNPTTLMNEEFFEGINWESTDENGVVTENSLDFRDEGVFYNGEMLFSFTEDISRVIMELPNSDGVFVKLGKEEHKYDAGILFDAMKEATKIREKKHAQVKIFPNPITPEERLFIESPVSIGETYIFDSHGRLVYEYHKKWKDKLEVKNASFHSGIYFVNLKTSDTKESIVRKLLITSGMLREVD